MPPPRTASGKQLTPQPPDPEVELYERGGPSFNPGFRFPKVIAAIMEEVLAAEADEANRCTLQTRRELAAQLIQFLTTDKALNPKQGEALLGLCSALTKESTKNFYLDMPTGSQPD